MHFFTWLNKTRYRLRDRQLQLSVKSQLTTKNHKTTKIPFKQSTVCDGQGQNHEWGQNQFGRTFKFLAWVSKLTWGFSRRCNRSFIWFQACENVVMVQSHVRPEKLSIRDEISARLLCFFVKNWTLVFVDGWHMIEKSRYVNRLVSHWNNQMCDTDGDIMLRGMVHGGRMGREINPMSLQDKCHGMVSPLRRFCEGIWLTNKIVP